MCDPAGDLRRTTGSRLELPQRASTWVVKNEVVHNGVERSWGPNGIITRKSMEKLPTKLEESCLSWPMTVLVTYEFQAHANL